MSYVGGVWYSSNSEIRPEIKVNTNSFQEDSITNYGWLLMPFKLCFLFEVSLHIQPSIYFYLHIFIHSFIYHSSVTNTVLKHEWRKETWEIQWLFVIYVQIIIHYWGKSRQELKQSRDMEAENGACRSHEGVLLPCLLLLLTQSPVFHLSCNASLL